MAFFVFEADCPLGTFNNTCFIYSLRTLDIEGNSGPRTLFLKDNRNDFANHQASGLYFFLPRRLILGFSKINYNAPKLLINTYRLACPLKMALYYR